MTNNLANYLPTSTNILANMDNRLMGLLPYSPYQSSFNPGRLSATQALSDALPYNPYQALFQDQGGLQPGDCLDVKGQRVPCGSPEDVGEVITEGELALTKENEELKAKLAEEGFLGIPGALKKVGDFVAGTGILIGAIGILILIVLVLKR